jgi:putative ABC transport system permease protein
MAGQLVLVAYRLVLRLYPQPVRTNHGDEMTETVEAEWRRRAGRGLRGVAAFFIWLAVDVTRSLPSLHFLPVVRRIRARSRRRVGGDQPSSRRGREPMRNLLQDLRHALRAFSRNPAFTMTAAVTLALGIGANTAVFSVVDRVLLRPLPYPESENLVMVAHPVPGYGSGEWGLSQAGYFYFKQNSQLLSDFGIYRSPAVVLTGGDQAERVDVGEITASVLSTLQAVPVLGRGITPEDDVPGAQPVVLLSHDLWTRRFGGDESIIGRMILVSGQAQEVIGVMPAGFHFPRQTTNLWRPLRLDPNAPPINSHFYGSVGRLQGEATTEDAVSGLRSLIARFPEDLPSAYSTRFFEESGFDVAVRTLLDDTVQHASRALWIVLGTVGLVLLMACANVANLFLVRAEGRRREVAVRTALGADRMDLLRYYMTESVVLAVTGGILGVSLACVGVDALIAMAPEGIPRLHELTIDVRALAAAGVVTAVAALLFGTVPLLHRGEHDLTEHLKEGTRTATSSRKRQHIRSGLVVSQIGIALVLLAASGLLLRSFIALQAVELGFNPQHAITARLSLLPTKYRDGEARQRFFETARERLEALPAVSSVGMTTQLEIVGRAQDNATDIGDLPDGGEIRQIIDQKFAGPGYFVTMGMRLLEGRYMERADLDAATPGAIVTRALAEEYWPGQSAVGKRIRPLFTRFPWHRVVGVIDDVRTEGIQREPKPTVYFPYTDVRPASLAAVIRSEVPLSALLPAVQREVWALDPDVPIAQVASMERIVADDMARTMFTLSLLGLAAAMALVLGAVGIYGVVSYSVTQRASEIGIRLALGAKAGQVGSMVLSQTMRLALLGIGIGLVAALALNRVINSMLFGVESTDPLTFVVVCALLCGVAAVAGFLPAKRAARVDPLETLRSE